MVYIKMNIRIAMVSTAAVAMLPFLPSIGLSGRKIKALRQCNSTRRESENRKNREQSADNAASGRSRKDSFVKLDCQKIL